jgi:hypothetical protein
MIPAAAKASVEERRLTLRVTPQRSRLYKESSFLGFSSMEDTKNWYEFSLIFKRTLGGLPNGSLPAPFQLLTTSIREEPKPLILGSITI